MHPTRFKEELKRFDPRLDLVFSGAKQRWEIIGVDQKRMKYLIKSFRLGEIDKLGVWVLHELYQNTPHKQGGAMALMRRLEEEQRREEEQQEKTLSDDLSSISGEAFDAMRRRDGQRISAPGMEFEIRDKRRLTPELVSAS